MILPKETVLGVFSDLSRSELEALQLINQEFWSLVKSADVKLALRAIYCLIVVQPAVGFEEKLTEDRSDKFGWHELQPRLRNSFIRHLAIALDRVPFHTWDVYMHKLRSVEGEGADPTP